MLIHIDTKGYTEKPKEHISIIKPRLQSKANIKDLSQREIINFIERGYTISPAVMDGNGCKADNWQQQQLFMIDIDNDKDGLPLLSVANALDICEKNGLMPSFYYFSFSHSEQKPKYRLCFITKEVVTSKAMRAVIVETLVKLFAQSDSSCKNADRVFYGTNKKAVICDLSATIDIESIGALFAEVYKDTCRYNATANEWYFFNGKVWVRDEGGMIVHNKAKELADGLLIYATTIEDEQQKKNYIDYVSKLGQLRFRETMVKDSRDIYFVTKSDFDKNLDLFNCQNGTLNLKTFDFMPHNSDDLLSKISNVVYEPSAHSVEWEKFINEVMQGDTEKIKYLQKILGYSLTADTNLETCFILYGATTRNGKSTLIETLLYLLGNPRISAVYLIGV